MNQVAFGIDLAGFSTGKSGLAKAQRDESGNITATIFRGTHLLDRPKASPESMMSLRKKSEP